MAVSQTYARRRVTSNLKRAAVLTGCLCIGAFLLLCRGTFCEKRSEEGRASTVSGKTEWEIIYVVDGEPAAKETVPDGETAQLIPCRCGDRDIVGWKDRNGTPVDLMRRTVKRDLTLYAVPGPDLRRDEPCLAPSEDGLFRGREAFTRSDAARAVYALLQSPMAVGGRPRDISERSSCCEAASALVAAGWMTLKESGRFCPDEPISAGELTALLEHIFAPSAVAGAMTGIGRAVTRGEAAVILTALTGREMPAEPPYYPDVRPDSEEYEAISAAAIPTGAEAPRHGQELCLHEGYLYLYDETGYFFCDGMHGTLYFGPDGRYTSGDAELDRAVAEVIAARTDSSMSRKEMLGAVYRFVRDHCLYMERNAFGPGENGWEISAAKTMLQTGKGDCYNFAAAFWALARGLGYDAYACTGTIGRDAAAHSWVEIRQDGISFVYDTETEMSYRLNPGGWHPDCFGMSPEEAAQFCYVPAEANR